MKKLVLVALVAATSAFAMTDGKSMVELNGCFDGGCDTLHFESTSLENPLFAKNADEESSELALNYNWLFTNNFGAGLSYRSLKNTTDGDIIQARDNGNATDIGINLFWNFSGGWESSYVAVRYNMINIEESDKDENGADAGNDDIEQTDITLEFGKRMEMGKVFGLQLLYSPSVSYTMTSAEVNSDFSADPEDRSGTELTINPVNFAVSF